MPYKSDIAAVAFGLLSAASWGAGDFSGGVATKRANVFGVVVVSQIAGFAVVLAVALLLRDPFPPLGDLLWGAAAGLVGVMGLVTFYRALSMGQMGIAAPVAAVFTAMPPVIAAVFLQGLPRALQIIGFALGLLGVWLLARPEAPTETGSARQPQGLWLAVIAGLSFGGFLVLIHQGNGTSAFWPLIVARATSVSILAVISALTQKNWLPRRSSLPIVLLAGVLDIGGNTFFVLAGQAGRLDVAGVLSSLYPASTVLLAAVLLHEQIARGRWLGIGLALLAVLLIALPGG